MDVLVMGISEACEAFLATNGLCICRQDVGDTALWAWLKEWSYDAWVINLDARSGDMHAIRVLREHGIAAAVIGIAGELKGMLWSKRRAIFLENGGDDLIMAPVDPSELLASLRAIKRRMNGLQPKVSEFRRGGAVLTINPATREVLVNDTPVHLTRQEYSILLVLTQNANRIFTKETLVRKLCDGSDPPEMKVIDVYVCKIRKKFKMIHPDAKFIQTVWGVGYRLSSRPDPRSKVNGELCLQT